MKKDILGLGLESSCDETAVSVINNGNTIKSNVIFSQIDIHRAYYGVVPEIASRSHLEYINALISRAMNDAGVRFRDLDYVAVSNRPGLIGSLLITLQSAKAISYTLGIPIVCINHLEAHLYAPFLEGKHPVFPFIGLLISGGNTILYHVKNFGDMEVLGKTMDDAVGEAFDKVAKYLDLGYPGGPAIEKLARSAVKKDVRLPKILADYKDYRFSYSGIKTAVINYFKNNPEKDKAEIVYSFQERALEILVNRAYSASRKLNIKNIVVAGGVACNNRLREMLSLDRNNGEEIIFPSPVLCTDNAAMVAGIGYRYYKMGKFDSLESDVSARL